MIDPTILTNVVRQDQHNPAFDILTWTIEPLSHEKIIDTTGGLFLLSGTGRDEHGTRSWSIVLKILNNPKEWAQDSRSWAYWKRELLAFQSGMLAALPTGLSAPRCYGTTEYADNGWIWMEHIVESSGRHWSMEQFHRAARQAGRCAGAFLSSVPLEEAGELEATVLDGYLAGLQDAGWSGVPQVVRLGYLLSAMLWMGVTLPGWAAVMLPEEVGINVPAMYGRSADAVLAGWVTLTEFLLSRADEARQLMGKLRLA